MSTTEAQATTTLTTDTAVHLDHPNLSIFGGIGGYFIARIAARASYGILSTYLAQSVTGSATVASIVVTIFFISELGLAPIFGNMSDTRGRRPFLILSPACGAAAVLIFGLITLLPGISAQQEGWERVGLILIFSVGRLLEGIAAAAITPAGLGFLADVAGNDEKKRVRVMTAFEIATVLGVVVGIPIGNILYQNFGVQGFFGVLFFYFAAVVVFFVFVQESSRQAVAIASDAHTQTAGSHGKGFSREAFSSYRTLLSNKRLMAFVPAWLAVNAILAAMLGLIQFVLSLPTAASGARVSGRRDADVKFPHQLLVGGFKQGDIAVLLGTFGSVLIVGMVLWTFIMPRIGRANTMRVSVGGFFILNGALAAINRLADNPQTLTPRDISLLYVLLPLVGLGILAASGFAPAALTHLAALSEEDPTQRGAIMGLYSLLLGGGQLLGTWIGGIFVDISGFNGLVLFSFILTGLAAWSVQKSQAHLEDHPAIVPQSHAPLSESA